jgi:predicted MPP superfamily phosphohydrolase
VSKRKRWFFIYLPGAILLLFLFLHQENNDIVVTTHKLASHELPQGLEGYRIVHLSDLQSKEFGKEQRPLLRKVKELKPDLILMTGDLVDSSHFDRKASMMLMDGLLDIAPLYFSVGNHEYAVPHYPEMEKEMIAKGVHVLRNALEYVPAGAGQIALIGVDDPIFNRVEDGDVAKINSHLDQALQEDDGEGHYRILLSHRPELFDVYAERGFELSLAGHAHGGQIRIPFVGGMYSPGQGSWPKLAEGIHLQGGSALIVNRGLGNSIFPQRLFNRPEIVLIELSSGDPETGSR